MNSNPFCCYREFKNFGENPQWGKFKTRTFKLFTCTRLSMSEKKTFLHQRDLYSSALDRQTDSTDRLEFISPDIFYLLFTVSSTLWILVFLQSGQLIVQNSSATQIYLYQFTIVQFIQLDLYSVVYNSTVQIVRSIFNSLQQYSSDSQIYIQQFTIVLFIQLDLYSVVYNSIVQIVRSIFTSLRQYSSASQIYLLQFTIVQFKQLDLSLLVYNSTIHIDRSIFSSLQQYSSDSQIYLQQFTIVQLRQLDLSSIALTIVQFRQSALSLIVYKVRFKQLDLSLLIYKSTVQIVRSIFSCSQQYSSDSQIYL